MFSSSASLNTQFPIQHKNPSKSTILSQRGSKAKTPATATAYLIGATEETDPAKTHQSWSPPSPSAMTSPLLPSFSVSMAASKNPSRYHRLKPPSTFEAPEHERQPTPHRHLLLQFSGSLHSVINVLSKPRHE